MKPLELIAKIAIALTLRNGLQFKIPRKSILIGF